jgi:hypothetical protein
VTQSRADTLSSNPMTGSAPQRGFLGWSETLAARRSGCALRRELGVVPNNRMAPAVVKMEVGHHLDARRLAPSTARGYPSQAPISGRRFARSDMARSPDGRRPSGLPW